MLYSFDALNRMTGKDRPGSELDVAYSYDLRGLQLSASFPTTGEAVTNSYDKAGRLTASTTAKAGATRTLGYQYDANGNRTRLTWPDGFFVGYDRDGLGRVTAVRENGTAALATYAYDAQGRRAGVTRGNGVTTSYLYDPASRLAQLSHDLAGTDGDLTIGLSYNPAGQIVTRTGSNDAYAWTGHGAGGLGYGINGLNQITDRSGTTVSHDAKLMILKIRDKTRASRSI